MALVGPLLEICNPLFEVGTAVSVVGSLDGTKGPDRHRGAARWGQRATRDALGPR